MRELFGQRKKLDVTVHSLGNDWRLRARAVRDVVDGREVDFTSPQDALRGRVLDVSGQAAIGARVVFKEPHTPDAEGGRPRMPQPLEVDAEGRFRGLLSVKRLVVEQGNVLAQSLAQREMALAKAREMKKVTDLKSQFIAHVTHELRSPVNAILGLSELMKLALERGEEGQAREKLALLAASAVGLRAIITNILDLSKIEAGKMEVVAESFDLATLLREVAVTTRVLLGDKPVAVEVEAPEEPFPFASDPIKVRQVLVNLTSNAAKFTERGEIRLTLEKQTDGIRLAVSDTGVGIREADLEKLFTAFSQLEDARTRRHEGTGLGLTITRQMVGLLGGRIRVDSTYGRGTTFTVLLPAAIPQNERAANE